MNPADYWTEAQIMSAIAHALHDRDMHAAAALVNLLAVNHPESAETIRLAVSLLAGVNGGAG